jgi:hypothetical protein
VCCIILPSFSIALKKPARQVAMVETPFLTLPLLNLHKPGSTLNKKNGPIDAITMPNNKAQNTFQRLLFLFIDAHAKPGDHLSRSLSGRKPIYK